MGGLLYISILGSIIGYLRIDQPMFEIADKLIWILYTLVILLMSILCISNPGIAKLSHLKLSRLSGINSCEYESQSSILDTTDGNQKYEYQDKFKDIEISDISIDQNNTSNHIDRLTINNIDTTDRQKNSTENSSNYFKH